MSKKKLVLKCLRQLRHACFASMLFLSVCLAAQQPATTISVAWEKDEGALKTVPTLQVVVNPPLRPASPIHNNAWESLRALQADYVRFVPWYPYPRLGVAELEPPADGKTSWDFSLIDPLVLDFFHASVGRRVMLNFSTIPQWMFKTKEPVQVPSNPNDVCWEYEQGTELRDPSGKEVADYFARLVSWYTRGGFVDEYGVRHDSPHHFKIDYWEVLNEPEYEHGLSPEQYTRLYDAITRAVHEVSPETGFVGMSLAEPTKSPGFFDYFLNLQNHSSPTPPQMISYHFYAAPTADQTAEIHPFTFFDQADAFLNSVRFMNEIRHRHSPGTWTDVNEAGCILPEDIGQGARGDSIYPSYWNLCGAVFAHLYIGLAREGVEILGSSQLMGFPTQFPSVTMLNWETGEPNARYFVLKLIKDSFIPGDRMVETKSSTPYVSAQAFLSNNGTRKVLLVNKRDHSLTIKLSGSQGASMRAVDLSQKGQTISASALTQDQIVLGPFAVAVLSIKAN